MNTLDIEAFPKALRIRLEAEAARRGITLQELVMRYCSVGLEAAHYMGRFERDASECVETEHRAHLYQLCMERVAAAFLKIQHKEL